MLENHHVLPFMEAFRQGFQMRLQMDTLLSYSGGLGFRVQGLGNGRTIGKNAHSNTCYDTSRDIDGYNIYKCFTILFDSRESRRILGPVSLLSSNSCGELCRIMGHGY